MPSRLLAEFSLTLFLFLLLLLFWLLFSIRYAKRALTIFLLFILFSLSLIFLYPSSCLEMNRVMEVTFFFLFFFEFISKSEISQVNTKFFVLLKKSKLQRKIGFKARLLFPVT